MTLFYRGCQKNVPIEDRFSATNPYTAIIFSEHYYDKRYKQLFESEIEDWYTDESLWPKNRTRKLFDEWFDVDCHSVLIDTVDGKIIDDEI